MAYGRIYIDNLRKKVTALFDELRADNRLCEKNFIETFKQKYPKDYSMLQYEWEFKVHEFKKNRKGNPKPQPIRPERILKNMYRNYYFKLIKNPSIKKSRKEVLNNIKTIAGQYGYKIKRKNNDRYDVTIKKTDEIVCENITFAKLKQMFSPQEIRKLKEGVSSNGKSRNKQT